MGAVAPEEIARLWAQEGITVERAIGQIVQQLVTMQASLDRQAQALGQLRTAVATLALPTGEPTEKGKRTHRPK